LVDDADIAQRRIRRLTDNLNRTDVSVTRIDPTMEDVFVALIEKEDRHDGKAK
jgi:hypothetical protein